LRSGLRHGDAHSSRRGPAGFGADGTLRGSGRGSQPAGETAPRRHLEQRSRRAVEDMSERHRDAPADDRHGEADDGRGEATAARSSRQVQIGYALSLVLLAAVLVMAARTDAPPETDRLGRRVELVELIRAEQSRAEALSARVD